MATKTLDQLAREVIHGKWGSGKTRKEKLTKAGYDYDAVQKRVNELVVALDVLDGKYGKGDQRKAAIEKAGYDYNVIQDYVNKILETDKDRSFEEIVEDMNYWATKIAADNRYHYNKWGNALQSHLCPICSGLKYEDDKTHFGWNCIGFTAAVWRHGGRLGNTCKCGWVSCPNGNAEYLLSRPADEALKLAKRYTGLKDVVLIRNKSGIPKSQWRAGDICFRFNGDTCDHLFYYMGGDKIADATGSNGTTPNNTQIAVRNYKNYSAKVIIRYTGGKKPAPTPTPKKYTGKLPTTKLVKSNDEVIADALKFAKWIINDNRFGYGRMGGSKYKGTKEYSITHSGGCHFCGSNAHKISEAKKAGIKNPEEWEFTYVCNTFVHACYAHAGIPSMLNAKGHAWWTGSYQKSSYWTEVHPKKVSDLKPGDILGNETHYVMYIGNGKGAQATSRGNVRSGTKEWGKSIDYFDIASFFKKTDHVFRLTKAVNTTMLIRYGEVSYRVAQIQAFLDWYYDGKVGSADGCYGDNTLKWVKKFQAEKFGAKEADGIVGPKTLTAMENATK